jgi:hypothetical protein
MLSDIRHYAPIPAGRDGEAPIYDRLTAYLLGEVIQLKF